jgi:hypothetical protein
MGGGVERLARRREGCKTELQAPSSGLCHSPLPRFAGQWGCGTPAPAGSSLGRGLIHYIP